MPIRTTGGVFDEQVLTGSLAHYVVCGADFSGAINSYGQPVPYSAAEIIFTKISTGAYINIMNPNECNLSFALEADRSIWDEISLTAMIQSLGTDVGSDHIDCSVCTVKRVPYVWGACGTGATSFLELTDTPDTYAGAIGYLVSVNNTGTGLVFTPAPSPPAPPPPIGFIDLDDTPFSYAGSANYVVTVNPGETGLIFTPPPAPAPDTFLELLDTPDTYAGSANYIVTVNSGATGLVFMTPPPPPPDTFLELLDTPDTYVGSIGYLVSVNDTGTGLVFTPPPQPPAPPLPIGFLDLYDTPLTYAGSANYNVTVNPTATGLIFTPAGSSPNAFSFVEVPTQPSIAATGSDTLTFLAGNNIALTTNATNKTVTISNIAPVVSSTDFIPVFAPANLLISKKYFVTSSGVVTLPALDSSTIPGSAIFITKEIGVTVFVQVGDASDLIFTDSGNTDALEMDITAPIILICRDQNTWDLQIGSRY